MNMITIRNFHQPRQHRSNFHQVKEKASECCGFLFFVTAIHILFIGEIWLQPFIRGWTQYWQTKA